MNELSETTTRTDRNPVRTPGLVRACGFLTYNLFSELVKSLEEDTAWNYYENGTLSIELLMNDQLQKDYFRCKDKVGNTVV